MKITTTGRKIDITEGLKSYVEKKLSKLAKFFDESASAQATLSVQKDNHIIEVTVHYDGLIFRAEVRDRDMYTAIDKVGDVIERQIRKQRTKIEKQLKSSVFYDFTSDISVAEEPAFKIVKTKKYENKPMSPEEAILQMNLLGHEFYIFNNAESMDKEVVYKRKDGNYGLIELK